MPFLEIVFWCCLAAIAYSYVLYPIVLLGLARLFGNASNPPEAIGELPSTSLLIAAFNEESVIGERLENALQMDYPPEKLEIVIASDGSDDRTCDIVRSFQDSRIRLLDYQERRGKATVLNASVPQLRGEIVMLSDANTFSDPATARNLVRWFADPAVGAVCGRLILTDPVTGRNADSLYWKYETFLKKCEARLGALLGANGAVYAIRKSLFVPIPGSTIVDDFVIPLLAKLRSGCALIYDQEAVAHEESAPHVRDEFRRRTRIGAGGFQSIGILWRLLDPRQGWLALAFASHKILRWLCPFFMIGLLIANVLLVRQPMYRYLLALQGTFYLLSLAAAYIPANLRLLKPLRLTTMFTSMNVAILIGFFRWLRGSQSGIWKRTARVAEAGGVNS